MKRLILLLTIYCMLAPVAMHALTAREAFVSAPKRIIPLIDNNTRLDMLDYFSSGMKTASNNALNGKSSVTALSDAAISINLTDASTIDIAVLPCGNDTVIAVIKTVATPAPDSKLSVYSKDWNTDLTASSFTKPLLKDWLTSEGRKNQATVESTVPFLLVGYSFDPATMTLTLTDNTASFMPADVFATVSKFISPKLVYKWNGRKFQPAK